MDDAHQYLQLVRYVAGRIYAAMPERVELDDLINEGTLGLLDAMRKFDSTRGAKFETYATARISGAIFDALRALDWISRATRRRTKELERRGEELERTPVFLSLQEAMTPRSGSRPLAETLRDEACDVALGLEERELHSALIESVSKLPPPMRRVIKGYYFEGTPFKEIKRELGLSESRISQIHTQAVARLRAELRAQALVAV